MTRELRCRDVGFDCDAVVTAESDDEILRQAAEHAKDVHAMTDDEVDDPSFTTAVQAQIHDKA